MNQNAHIEAYLVMLSLHSTARTGYEHNEEEAEKNLQ